MTPILEILKRQPNEPFQCMDDKLCQSYILELGLAGRFKDNPPNIPKGLASRQGLGYTQHPTHYILAVLFKGNPDAKDNGYMLLCVPKSKMNLEQFNSSVMNFLGTNAEYLIESSRFDTRSPIN